MLKILIFEKDLVLLAKLKKICSSVSVFNEVKTANDQDSCLNLVKNELFDIFILNIFDNRFKQLLLNANENIVNGSILSTNIEIDLTPFLNYLKFDVSDKNFSVVSFLSTLSKLLPKEILSKNEQLLDSYVPIKIFCMRRLKNAPCNFFIRLGMDKYVRIIFEEDEIQSSFLDHYELKNVTELFIKRTDFYRHSHELFAFAMPKMENVNSQINYFSQSQKMIKEIVAEIGINENVINLATELLDSVLLELNDTTLVSLFEKFKHSDDRYIYDHSSLTAIFALDLCERFEWKNTQVSKKMIFASMFHDFGFKETGLAMFEFNYRQNKNLTQAQAKEIFEHPLKITELLSKNPSVSSEVLGIISRHHECHGEFSYPSGKPTINLSVLESVFLVAHEFSHELYKIAFRPDKILKAVNHVLAFSNNPQMKSAHYAFNEMTSAKFQIKKNN